MDLHPIIVHFPIALLTIYGIMELIRPKRLLENESWTHMKAMLVIVGVIGAFFALSSGDVAAHQLADRSLRNIVEVHEQWASITTTIFTILGVTYILSFLNRKYGDKIKKAFDGKAEKPWNLLIKLKNIIDNTPLIYLFAIAGLIAVTITGALGGAIVYGPNADPIVSLIYNIFF